MRLASFVLVCALQLALAGFGHAQNYPAKNIRIVVPYPAGGPTDLVGRTVAEALTKELKRTVVVENKAGAVCPISPPNCSSGKPGSMPCTSPIAAPLLP